MRHRKFWVMAAICVMLYYCVQSRAAVTEDTFMVRSTGDLIQLCTAAPPDPMASAALHFCHGFAVGAFRVLQEMESAQKIPGFCLPEPMPTRNESMKNFVQWGNTNPDKLALPPQDGIEAFLVKQYPCPRRK